MLYAEILLFHTNQLIGDLNLVQFLGGFIDSVNEWRFRLRLALCLSIVNTVPLCFTALFQGTALIVRLHILHLNCKELTRVKRLDNELRPAHLALSLTEGLRVPDIHQFLILPVFYIVGELKTILHLNALLGWRLTIRVGFDCVGPQDWQLDRRALNLA